MVIPILSFAVSSFVSLFFPALPGHYRATQWPLVFIVPDTLAVMPASDSTMRSDTIHTAAGSSFVVEKMAGIDPRFEPVIAKLVQDGWAETDVRTKFSDTRTAYIPRLVRIPIRKPSATTGGASNAYAWVNTKTSADACQEFLDRYATFFDQAKAKYGVDPEIVAALLRCETQLGKVTGDYHVFSVYATMALMDQPDVLNDNISHAEEDLRAEQADSDRTKAELDRIRARSASKATWAYKELNALMEMDCERQVNAMELKGSWAGAFGWTQFLPSSFLRSAVDGNGDHQINLFNPADAIFSVANYLSGAGYRSNDREKASKALWNYNNSTAYVESIMGLADRLKAKSSN